MRSIAASLALALLATLVLAASASAADSLAFPARSVGDTWTLVGSDGLEITVLVKARETIDVAGVPTEVLVQESTSRIDGEVTDVTTDRVRASDGAFVSSEYGALSGNPFTFTWDSPCTFIDWPLSVGKSWTTACTGRDGASPDVTTVNQSSVVRQIRDVTVGAGTFSAFIVETTQAPGMGNVTENTWFAPGACDHVKTMSLFPGHAPSILTMSSQSCKLARSSEEPAPQDEPSKNETPRAEDDDPPAEETPSPTTKPTPASPTLSLDPATFDYTCRSQFTQADCDKLDQDGDGWTTEEERQYDTNPNLADSDGDGVVDTEDKFGLDPDRSSPAADVFGVLIAATVAAFALAFARKR